LEYTKDLIDQNIYQNHKKYLQLFNENDFAYIHVDTTQYSKCCHYIVNVQGHTTITPSAGLVYLGPRAGHFLDTKHGPTVY
jgi:hypothetical protein